MRWYGTVHVLEVVEWNLSSQEDLGPLDTEHFTYQVAWSLKLIDSTMKQELHNK